MARRAPVIRRGSRPLGSREFRIQPKTLTSMSALALLTRHVRVADSVEPRHRACNREDAADERDGRGHAAGDRHREYAERFTALAVHELTDARDERTAHGRNNTAATTGRLTHQRLGHRAS